MTEPIIRHPVARTDDPAKALRQLLSARDYPCVGAKAALGRGQLNVLVTGPIGTPSNDAHITDALQKFAQGFSPERHLFSSQAVIFEGPAPPTEAAFEACLWDRLMGIHNLDRANYAWDPDAARDPGSPNFAFSVGGKGFFVVGLHPNASRWARRFDYPALVFNPHAQFETLRQDGRYEAMREKVLQRDAKLQGHANPMLMRHGEGSAAQQYSGRLVEANWRCPFDHDQPN